VNVHRDVLTSRLWILNRFAIVVFGKYSCERTGYSAHTAAMIIFIKLNRQVFSKLELPHNLILKTWILLYIQFY